MYTLVYSGVQIFKKTKNLNSVNNKITKRLKDLPCEERPKIWGNTSSEERRAREGLIQTYKTANGLESID